MNCISLGFNVLYQFILKQIDDEELCKQHLLPLFEHWRNLIGQDKFYSETEKEAYISLAKKNAELVTLLPPIDKLFPVTIEKLYGLYGEALSVFFFSSIRGLFINCPEVIPRNEESYLGSWHYIFERLRYLEKCFDALIKHTGKEPVAFHTHCLVNLPQDLSEDLIFRNMSLTYIVLFSPNSVRSSTFEKHSASKSVTTSPRRCSLRAIS
jgi:hypothetical protein